MSQTSQGVKGQVVAFKRSSGYVHKKAMENRRGRHYLEAVELLRRALEQAPEDEDIQLDLAETLSEMECFEESNRLLLRILTKDMSMGEAYYGLAVNYCALQKREEALDALANYLHLCPDGPYWEDAQDLMENLSVSHEGIEPFRQELLLKRGIAAMGRDQGDKAIRLLKRGLKIARDKSRSHSILSIAYLTQGTPDKALYHAKMALAGDPDSVQARCTLCLILQKMGKTRAAMGFLKQTENFCQTPNDELLFCRAAQELGGQELTYHFLTMQTKVSPYRITTLHQLAAAYYAMGENAKAENLWVRIARIDPENAEAQVYLKMLRKGEALDFDILQRENLPREEVVSRLTEVASALAGGTESWQGAWNGSDDLKAKVRWAFSLPDEKLHGALLNGVYQAAKGENDGGQAVDLLKELLVIPDIPDGTRRKAVYILAQLEIPTPYLMLHQKRLTQVTCAPQQAGDPVAWKEFLRMLLIETRELKSGREVAFFAAACWKRLDESQRTQAAGQGACAWVMAMKALYLRSIDREDLVVKLVVDLPISQRRVQRAMNILYECLPQDVIQHITEDKEGAIAHEADQL